jgi:DNA end-binding protein Ku
MLWPDEVREPEFETLRTEVELRPQEMQMASSLVESLSGDFQSDQFEDDYRQAMVDLIDYKIEHGGGRPTPEAAPVEEGDDMTDLLTALRRSVEAAGGKAPAEEPAAASSDTKDETWDAPAEEKPKRSRAKKTAEKDDAPAEEAPKKSTTRKSSKKKSDEDEDEYESEETAAAKGGRSKTA